MMQGRELCKGKMQTGLQLTVSTSSITGLLQDYISDQLFIQVYFSMLPVSNRLQGKTAFSVVCEWPLMCVWILRKTHGVEPLAAFNSCVRILWMIQIIVGVVAWNVLMALHVVVVRVLISEMILITVVLVLKSVLAKTGALMQCVIMVDELLIH